MNLLGQSARTTRTRRNPIQCWRILVLLSTFLTIAPVTAGRLRAGPNTHDDGEPAPLFRVDFESDSDAAGQILNNGGASLSEGNGTGGGTALQVDYVGYDRGSKRVISIIKLPEKHTHATLNYDVKFTEEFDFVRGGKLHGLGPANRVTGGGEMTPAGWSSRVMFGKNGSVHTYTYCQNKDTKWGRHGTNLNEFRFEHHGGTYVTVSLYVRLNDPPGKKNGRSVLFVDGKRVHEDTGIQFRTVGNDRSKIQKFLFSTFHGGSSPEWAPRDEDGNYRTVTAYFDNIEVYPGKHVRKPIPPEHR